MNQPSQKIILFGGAEFGQAPDELKMIGEVINNLKPKQVLHIPYARTETAWEEWEGDYFNRNIKLAEGIEYLNAEQEGDLDKAERPLLFLSGGRDNLNLIKKISESQRLQELITKAECIIGESAGAKILATSFRVKGSDENSQMAKGLGLIKDAVIEPHYTQRNRRGLLIKDMRETGAKYGLGLDAMTALEFSTDQFPEDIKKMGAGIAELLTEDSAKII